MIVVAAGSAGATEPDDAEPAELEPVSVKARLVGEAVRIDVRFELNATGPAPPPGDARTFALPERGVITAATALVGGQSHRLQLLAQATVDKKLEALNEPPTNRGGRLSSIRLDASDNMATLNIAVPHHTTIRLDVTLEVPTCYADDARHFIAPPSWADRVAGATRIEKVLAIDESCAEESEGRIRFAIPVHDLARRPGGAERIGFHSARVPLATQDVARLEITLAKQVSDVPRDLHTVFVVDHSRSLTAEQFETQRAVIAAYLRAAPRARVQLVGYTRDARTQLAGWMLASQAGARIERQLRSLPPRNGSNVDVGVATAATLLASVTGTRRVVVFTDALLSRNQEDEATQAAATVGLPAGTILHVVDMSNFQPELVREDEHALALLAKQTEGIVMSAGPGTSDALPLVRPVSLDNITINSPGWAPLFDGPHCLHEPVLLEGSACNFIGVGPKSGGPFEVTGMLWNTKVTRTIVPDPRGARSLARLLSTVSSGLPSELLDPILNAAVAVNSAWSLFAIWGKGGYADQESYATFGFGRIGTSSMHTSSRDTGFGTGFHHANDEVRAQLTPRVHGCKPRGVVRVIVELTKEEIVGVEVYARDKRDEALAECITNNVWDTMLVLPASRATDVVVTDVVPEADSVASPRGTIHP